MSDIEDLISPDFTTKMAGITYSEFCQSLREGLLRFYRDVEDSYKRNVWWAFFKVMDSVQWKEELRRIDSFSQYYFSKSIERGSHLNEEKQSFQKWVEIYKSYLSNKRGISRDLDTSDDDE